MNSFFYCNQDSLKIPENLSLLRFILPLDAEKVVSTLYCHWK